MDSSKTSGQSQSFNPFLFPEILSVLNGGAAGYSAQELGQKYSRPMRQVPEKIREGMR